MKTKTITVFNQKGGIGKSTLAMSLSYSLGKLGKKVLLIDFDSQGNASQTLGININEDFTALGNYIYEYAVTGQMCSIHELINVICQPSYFVNERKKGEFGYHEIEKNYPFYLMPVSCAAKDMILIENSTIPQRNFVHQYSETEAFYMLQKFVKMIEKNLDFEYIIIDTNPALSVTSLNAIIACQYLIIPCMVTRDSIAGVNLVYDIIEEVALNSPNFINLGVILQKYSDRRNLDKFFEKELRDSDIPVFDTMIPDASNRINQASAQGRLINDVDDKMAEAFDTLAVELIQKIDEQEKIKERMEK